MRKRILTLGMLLLTCFCSFAQDAQQQYQVVEPASLTFRPHWYLQAQGGVGYDVGESYFSHLISPTIQLAVGYNFSELFGARLSLSGLWARNRYAYPETTYKWNYLQPAIEGNVDLGTLFMGKDDYCLRNFRANLFAGIGLAYSFNNDDAVNASKSLNVYGLQTRPFEKLWKNPKCFAVFRFGLSADYQLSELLALNAEVNGNMMSDHFNSKKGKNDNVDWHFNFLVGVKINLTRPFDEKKAVLEPLPYIAQPVEKVDTTVDVPIDKISFNVNIYFLINQSIIRSNQMAKLNALVKYLNEHPRAFVRLSGFADKDTGTPAINMRLSRERSNVVSKFLQDVGIEEWRIRRFAKGDTVQPFDIPEDNRVCICFVYDPDNPVPQAFEY